MGYTWVILGLSMGYLWVIIKSVATRQRNRYSQAYYQTKMGCSALLSLKWRIYYPIIPIKIGMFGISVQPFLLRFDA